MFKKIKALFLDLDNTLYEYDPCNDHAINSVVLEISRRCGISKNSVYTVMLDSRERLKKDVGEVANSHSRLLYIQKTVENLCGRTDADFILRLHDYYWDKYFDKMVLYTGVSDLLLKLNEKNISIAVVTDNIAEIQFRKLKKLGIDDKFNYLISSEEAGVEKPHPKIFQLALEKVQCLPNECLMVGDELKKDVEGAKLLGINAIHAQKGNFIIEVMNYVS